MPGSNVRLSVPVSQVTQTSQPQDTARVRTVQSSVETQTSIWDTVSNVPNPISMVNPIHSNVPSSRPRTPKGDFEELERFMSSLAYPANSAVPRPRPGTGTPQQLPILSGHTINSAIPISHNPHEGPGGSGYSEGT